jgi:outer membrane protein assembly factor BamB
LNASTGTPIWHYATGDSVASSPAVADGRVFVGSLDGKVYAFGPLPIVQTFSVSFTESGLPSGMGWWVDVNGDNRSSDLSMISFSLPSGTYAYSAGALGYSASPPADSVTVNGTNTNKQVTFTHIPEFPSLLILSPENGTFNASDVPLTFTVDVPIGWIGYSLDGGASTTVAGNATIAVSEGFHNVVAYANSTAGNMSASPKVYFTVDMTPPEIVKVSQDPPTANVLHDQEVIISVNATDLISGVKSVRLTYSTNTSALTLDSPMAFNRAYGLWQYTIWGQQAHTLVKYKITAYDNAGNSLTDDNTGQYYVYTVVITEFPTVLVPALFMTATLLVATILQKRENFKKRDNRRLQRLLADT